MNADATTLDAGSAQVLYRVDDAARLLAMSPSMIRLLTNRGSLPCRRIGRMVRYAPEDLAYFIDRYRDHPYR